MSDSGGVESPTIRVMMMPRDTNAQGTIFGGVILSYIDQAGALAAMGVVPRHFVTVAMDSIEFKQPVFTGDVLSLYTTVEHVGRTSVRVRIRVDATRWSDHVTTVRVTEASAVYVAVDEKRRKVEIKPPSK